MSIKSKLHEIKESFKGKKMAPAFNAFHTFLFTPNDVTVSGTHVKVADDLKRTMNTVIMSLVPCLIFGIFNAGYQHNIAIDASNGILTQVSLFGNFLKGKDKKLVYVSSKVGSIGDNSGGGSYIYRSSKTALNQVVKSLSIDLNDQGFEVVAVHPGWVQTDMGGPNALIDVTTSVAGLINVITNLNGSDSGKFFNYDGQTIPW